MNALVTALPGLVPIFVSAGGVNALAGVLLILGSGASFRRAETSSLGGLGPSKNLSTRAYFVTVYTTKIKSAVPN